MRGGKLLQLLDRQPIADHPLVGDDVGGALAAVEQRHLAEAQARSDRRHPLLAFAWDPDLDADRAAGHHEEELCLGALADDDLALVEDQRPHDGFDEPVFLGLQSLEQVEFGKGEFRP